MNIRRPIDHSTVIIISLYNYDWETKKKVTKRSTEDKIKINNSIGIESQKDNAKKHMQL